MTSEFKRDTRNYLFNTKEAHMGEERNRTDSSRKPEQTSDTHDVPVCCLQETGVALHTRASSAHDGQ